MTPPRSPNPATSSAPRSSGTVSGGSSGEPSGDDRALAGREILICVCGGIAAYKVADVVSKLVQSGAGVTVAMTKNARRFVGELTFRALSGRPVFTSPWRSPSSPPPDSYGAIPHLKLTEQAELILVAPATANIIGKLANGLADNFASDLLLGANCPVLLAPAMNTRMLNHPAVQRNLKQLNEWGFRFVGPESGWLACREVGAGRMSAPEAIVAAIAAEFAAAHRTRTDQTGGH